MNNEEYQKNIENENLNSQENNIIQENFRGEFLNKKILKLLFLIIAAILIFIIFRKEFFGNKNQVQEEKITKIETPTKNVETTERSYDDLKELEDKDYGELTEEETSNYVTENDEPYISEEEQNRLNRLRELEEESVTALRSPTTITIATRPIVENSVNGTFLSNNKPVSDYDGNRQESKKNFLMNEPAQRFYQQNFLTEQLSEFEIKAGDFIPATMITGINSDLPSKAVVAQVSENIYDTITGKNLLIPQGTKVIGTYDSAITFGQERLIVIWQRLIFPNGKSIGLDNMQGVDLSGQAGVTGITDNHFSTLLKGVLLSSLLGSAGSITVDRKDWRRAAVDGAGEQIVVIGERFAEKALSRQPTIIIEKGERFNITVHSDLILEPYEN